MIQPRKLEERVNTDSIPRGEEYPTIQYEPAALSCPVLSDGGCQISWLWRQNGLFHQVPLPTAPAVTWARQSTHL